MDRGIFGRDYNLRPHPTHPFYYVFRCFSRAVFVLFFRREVHGRAHLTREGGGVLVVNHASFLDPPLAGEPWPRPLYYFARHTLFFGPVLTWILNACRSIPVRRGASDIRALRRALSAIEDGDIVVLFPEGTRTQDGRLQPGRVGAGMIAQKTRARIFPCYIEGSWKIWPRGRLPRPGKIRVFYGPSFVPEELYQMAATRESYQRISDLMMQHIARLENKARL